MQINVNEQRASGDCCTSSKATNCSHRRRWAGAIATVALVLSAFAGPAKASGILIGVVFPSQNQARWAWEQKILAAQAKANGDETIFQYSNENAATQKNQVESMIQRKVKVLIMTPIDAQAASGLVKEAQSQGIKVITYDRGVSGATANYHISRNTYDMGALQASSAVAAVPCGDYAVIRGDQSTLAEVDMGRAYDKVLTGKTCIKIVYDTLTPGWDTASAQKEAEAALQKDPDIKAFVVMWDNAAQAVVQALKSAGKKPGQVWVTGADALTPSLAYIAQGWQSQTDWSPFDKMATDAANLAHDLGTGKAPPPPTDIVNGTRTDYVNIVSVTHENLCDFINKIAPKGWVSEEQVFGSNASTCK